MLGGLAPGTAALNALIKMRATTGVTRANPDASPVFKSGQILDELVSANGGAVTLGFTFPTDWTVGAGRTRRARRQGGRLGLRHRRRDAERPQIRGPAGQL